MYQSVTVGLLANTDKLRSWRKARGARDGESNCKRDWVDADGVRCSVRAHVFTTTSSSLARHVSKNAACPIHGTCVSSRLFRWLDSHPHCLCNLGARYLHRQAAYYDSGCARFATCHSHLVRAIAWPWALFDIRCCIAARALLLCGGGRRLGRIATCAIELCHACLPKRSVSCCRRLRVRVRTQVEAKRGCNACGRRGASRHHRGVQQSIVPSHSFALRVAFD